MSKYKKEYRDFYNQLYKEPTKRLQRRTLRIEKIKKIFKL